MTDASTEALAEKLKALSGVGPAGQELSTDEIAARLRMITKNQSLQAKREDETVDTNEGSGFIDRLKAGLKVTKAGTINYLKETYGPENVKQRKSGRIVIRKPDGSLRVHDPETGVFSADIFGDIADAAGDVLEATPGIVGSIVGGAGGAVGGGAATGGAGALPGGAKGALVGGAIGDAGGSIIRQGVSAMIPGDDELTPKERAGQVAMNVGGGLLGEGVTRVGGRAARALLPSKRLAQEISEDATKQAAGAIEGTKGVDYMQEGLEIQEAISRELGEDFRFSVGQATGSRKALLKERTLSQLPDTIDVMTDAQTKRLAQTGRFMEKTIESVAADPSKLGRETVGANLAAALDRRVKDLIDIRRQATKPLYDQAAKEAGDMRFIPTSNTVETLERLIGELDRTPDKSLSGPLKRQLKDLKASVSPTDPNGAVDLGFMNENLSFWSGVAGGSGSNVIKDLGKAKQRRVAAMMLDALNKDLDEAASVARIGAGAEALQKARSLYKELSKPIDGAPQKLIKRILDQADQGSGMRVVDTMKSLAKNDTPLFGDLIKMAEKVDPVEAANIKAGVMKDMFLDAGNFAPSGAAFGAGVLDAAEVSPAKLFKVLKDNRPALEAMYKGDRKALTKLDRLSRAVRRMSMGPGVAGSDTFPKFMMAAEMFDRGLVGKSIAVARQLPGIKQLDEKLFNHEAMARMLSTSDGIDAIHRYAIARINGKANAAMNALNRMSAVLARHELFDRDPPEEE